jgi:hypothetical protein
MIKKRVTELKKGDIINPPNGEKVWLWRDGIKRRYTVTGIKPGMVNKRGQYIKIEATVPSPYREKESTIWCEMLETKTVTIYGANQ